MDLVIARYNESLDWLDESPFSNYTFRRVLVYHKGSAPPPTHPKITHVIPLSNVGRCDHTYLHHIIQNYDDMADMTIFLPGSLKTNNKWAKVEKMAAMFDMYPEGIEHTFYRDYISTHICKDYADFSIDIWAASNRENMAANPENELTPSPYRPFSAWFRRYFGDRVIYRLHALQGVFGISRAIVHNRPRWFYRDLIADLEVSSNPEVGHYFERGWAAVFDIRIDPVPDPGPKIPENIWNNTIVVNRQQQDVEPSVSK